MRITQQQLIHFFLNCLSAFGIWIMYSMLEVNTIRGDEFLSFLHSDPDWSYSDVIRHIHGGADNSYVHAIILRFAFASFGHTIVIQRSISMVAWLLGMLFLYGVIRKSNDKGFNSFLMVFTGFSNFGFFLATDGRFYSLLFCLAAASLFMYLRRERWSEMVALALFTVIQLFGLLTSPNFIVFQFLFAVAMVAMFIFDRNKKMLFLMCKWGGGMIAAASVYFLFFKIPYFHSYFLTGFFTGVPFCMPDITTFISIPFRWILLPHFPYGSDKVDALLFLIAVTAFAAFYLKDLVIRIKAASVESRLIGLMAAIVLLGLLIQVVLYILNGFPLWESRYYAAVFFVIAAALLLLLRDILTINIMLVCCFFWMYRLIAVEYPKIVQRTEALSVIEQRKVEIMMQPRPALFAEQMENQQSYMFVLMGNIYIRYPETRIKLFLKSDPAVPERMIYFQRLSEWHYPLGIVFEEDTSAFHIIEMKQSKP